MKGKKEFSVYWWSADGSQHEELRFVDVDTAMNRVMTLVKGPASKLGLVARVIITDGGDFTCFEWLKDKGLVYPPIT